MMGMMKTALAKDEGYNIRPSNDCRVQTKLDCRRIVFYKTNTSDFAIVNKTMCCYSKYLYVSMEKQEKMCDRCIDIHNSSLENPSISIFNTWPNVSYIDMSCNSIKILHWLLFYKTVFLSHLNLSHNVLEDLDNRTFSKTTQLSIIDMSYNSLNSLDDVTFFETTHLSKLNLSHNKLENLHSRTFFATTQLLHLDLSNNNLVNLSAKTFLTTTELYYINLSHNLLEKIDDHTFHTTIKLSHLDLSYNNLDYISEQLFFTLNTLKYLNLESNKLAILENERLFFSQKNLSSLILSNNQLTAIDVKVLMPLQSIKYLDLSVNPLNCTCDLLTTMIWCTNHSLENNATCVDSTTNTTESWVTLSNLPNCEPNVAPSDSSSNNRGRRHRGRYNPTTKIAIVIGSVFLSLAFGCVLTLVSIYCWKRLKNNSSEGREAIIDSAYNNVSENFYYSSVVVPEGSVTSFSTTPELPDRPPPEEARNFPHKYDYIASSSGLHQTVDVSINEDCKNVRMRVYTNSENQLPKEITVVNDLYK